MIDYEVTKIPNVVETSNLEPPNWYVAKTGGYLYMWTNLTNLKYNESITVVDDLKEVYYFGLGKKGKLGYIDGSYYDSCKSQTWLDDRSNPDMKFKFEVVEFYKEYELAEYQETFYLRSKGAEQSKMYYNGNNGFKEIIESKTADVIKLNRDIKDASNYFMSLPVKKREGFYNGFEYRVLSWDEVEKLVPYQLPHRQEDKEVIDSVAADVAKAHGDTSDIDPILVMYLQPGILKNEKGTSLKGKLNFAGNHRKKGSEASSASRMGVMFVPEVRTSNFGSLEIQQMAAADNPIPPKPKNPTGILEFVDIVRDMVETNKIPFGHSDIDDYLDSCNVKPKNKRKIRALAKDKNKHARMKTTPIAWSSKGWQKEGQKVVDKLTSDTSKACVCSVEAFNIEKFMQVRKEANENHEPVTDFYYLMYGKNGPAWEMWDYEPKGRASAEQLVEGARNEIYDKKEKLISKINVYFLRLPAKHSSFGINHTNFWSDSIIGKNWLKDEGIKLEDNK
tara:strand:+ start:591 stop:2105 length:1515 start_codon:yes stop_codon:yes gene_type:complete